MCSAEINGEKYIVANIYNNNIESEQVSTLKKLDTMLGEIENIFEHEIIIGGDYNFIFDKKTRRF